MVSWNNLLSASNSTVFHIFVKVLGLSSPADAGGVKEGDVVVSVQDTLVTMMKHAEVSQSVLKKHRVDLSKRDMGQFRPVRISHWLMLNKL